jgi:hypothetical protein
MLGDSPNIDRKKEISDVDCVSDSTGTTSLHKACANGHIRVVRYLLDKGADVFAVHGGGKSPLDEAEGHAEVEDLLISWLLEADQHEVEKLEFRCGEHKFYLFDATNRCYTKLTRNGYLCAATAVQEADIWQQRDNENFEDSFYLTVFKQPSSSSGKWQGYDTHYTSTGCVGVAPSWSKGTDYSCWFKWYEPDSTRSKAAMGWKNSVYGPKIHSNVFGMKIHRAYQLGLPVLRCNKSSYYFAKSAETCTDFQQIEWEKHRAVMHEEGGADGKNNDSSWKAWSGRKSGTDGYKFGDLTRKLLAGGGTEAVPLGVGAGAGAATGAGGGAGADGDDDDDNDDSDDNEDGRLSNLDFVPHLERCAYLSEWIYGDEPADPTSSPTHRVAPQEPKLQQIDPQLEVIYMSLSKDSSVKYQRMNSSGSCVQYALLKDEQSVHYVVFRGTIMTDIFEWFRNLDVTPRETSHGLFVHGGMLSALEHRASPVLASLTNQLSELGVKEVVLTGHSLGGGYAVISAAHLLSHGIPVKKVITFGSPQIVADQQDDNELWQQVSRLQVNKVIHLYDTYSLFL